MMISLAAGLLVAFTGCGSDTGALVPVVSSTASLQCIGCHATNSKSISSTTAVHITDEWQHSTHNSANGAGCLDCHSYAHFHDNNVDCRSCHATAHMNNGNSCSQCHGGSSATVSNCRSCHASAHQDPNSCNRCHGGRVPIDVAMKNPDAAGKCFGCHKDSRNFRNYSQARNHFNNFTGAGNHPAMYVTTNYQNSCTSCHEAHNPLLGLGKKERKAWAKSGHGNINGKAFAARDFKASTSCIRCHTATGYSNYLSNNWLTPFPLTTWATPGDKGREVLTCTTCHIKGRFMVKPAPAYIAPYNNNLSPKSFPNVGESNLCIACHSGRENEDSIAAFTNFSNASFKNSHYKVGAALMYMAAGFRNFTSLDTVVGTSTYRKTLYPDNVTVPAYGITGGVSSTHRKLGTTLINGDSHNTAFFVQGTADANGPCVTCHLNVNGVTKRLATGHTWLIDANAFNQLCVKCHDEEAGVPLTGANFTTLFLEEQAIGFVDALALITYLLETNYKIKYNPDKHPYFYDLIKDPTGNAAVKDWTRSKLFDGTYDQVLGKRLMGAAFNLNLLKKDKAAFVHARTFVRRLIFDTIDYLDDRTLNFSSGTTAIAYDPVRYGRNVTNAYTDRTLTTLAAGTTIDMVYLLGWSRTTGKWNSPVRP